MPLINPRFRLLPNLVDSTRRSWDPFGELHVDLQHTPAAVSLVGQQHELLSQQGVDLDHTVAAVTLAGQNHDLVVGLSLDHTPASVAIAGQQHELQAPSEVSYGPVTFNDTEGDQTYDLSSAIAEVMPTGHVLTGLAVHGSSPGALPNGVTLDVANQRIDFTDASGGVQASREVWIEVETAAEEITTFTLVES